MDDKGFALSDLRRGDLIQILLRLSVGSVITFYAVKWMVSQLDPTNKAKKSARKVAEKQLKRLTVNGFNPRLQNFTDHELMIAAHLVTPDDISTSWKNIAGLDSIIQELRETVVLPVLFNDKFKGSKLTQAPKGVLLHGPPGCGKTLIARATAKEAGMRFINLDVSILTDKWYGETQKLASAVFSLATKVQPCIIFIDEIDSFLRSRNPNDHEVTAMMKTQFMTLWDGLSTNTNTSVIVMGATNRPRDLDKAILRRMPVQFYIGLPSELQRAAILKLILNEEIVSENISYDKLSSLTDGFSGSDLCELCRNASVYRMREYVTLNHHTDVNEIVGSSSGSDNAFHTLKPITMDDLLRSLKKVRSSKFSNATIEARIDLD